MKLGEALILRESMKNGLNELKRRMNHNGKVQEGDQPVEDLNMLVEQWELLHEEFQKLVEAIWITNANYDIGDMTLSDALIKRQSLKNMGDQYDSFYRATTLSSQLGYSSEDRYVAVPLGLVFLDKMQKCRDEALVLETKIQRGNWEAELAAPTDARS